MFLVILSAKMTFLIWTHCQVSDSYYSLYKAKCFKDVVFPNYMLKLKIYSLLTKRNTVDMYS